VYDAQRLATLKDPAGVAQPITTRPELGKVGPHAVMYVATGQLLGTDDLVNDARRRRSTRSRTAC
jgi:type IV pilus assembly protein PilY1